MVCELDGRRIMYAYLGGTTSLIVVPYLVSYAATAQPHRHGSSSPRRVLLNATTTLKINSCSTSWFVPNLRVGPYPQPVALGGSGGRQGWGGRVAFDARFGGGFFTKAWPRTKGQPRAIKQPASGAARLQFSTCCH